jgi:hypothetical protein
MSFEDTLVEGKRKADVLGLGASRGGGMPRDVEGEAALPSLDQPYKAIANTSNDRVEELCIVMGRQARDAGQLVYRFFEYQHKTSDTGLVYNKDGSQRILLRYICPHPVTIILDGDELLRACDLLHLRCVRWIRLFDGGREFPRLEVNGGKKTELIRRIQFIYDNPKDDPHHRLGLA